MHDEQHIIYVNSQIRDDFALGRLMHDMWCIEANDMHYQILANRVRYFKENQEGVAVMCRAMEEMRRDTEFRTRVDAIRKFMLRLNLNVQEALEIMEIPEADRPRYIAAMGV